MSCLYLKERIGILRSLCPVGISIIEHFYYIPTLSQCQTRKVAPMRPSPAHWCDRLRFSKIMESIFPFSFFSFGHSAPGLFGGYNHSDSGCYIATCVYGSYDCPQVQTLRRFRDDTSWSFRHQMLYDSWRCSLCVWCFCATTLYHTLG